MAHLHRRAALPGVFPLTMTVILVLQPIGFAPIACGLGDQRFPAGSDDAKDILRAVESAYRKLSSYEDSGVVESFVERKASTPHKSTTSFSISFSRPDHVRLEWTIAGFDGQPLKSQLISDGQETIASWEWKQEYRRGANLRMGIAGATGVSSGAANTITRLLEAASGGITEFMACAEATRLEDEFVEGIPCHVVSANLPGVSRTYWIGRDDFLIRKVEQNIKSSLELMEKVERILPEGEALESHREEMKQLRARGDSTTRFVETHWDIRVNVDIPADRFKFLPPPGSAEVETFGAQP